MTRVAPSTLAALLSIAAGLPLAAQQVGITISNATLTEVQASSVGTTLSQSLPAGATGSNTVSVTTPEATAISQWTAGAGTTLASAVWNLGVSVSTPAPSFAKTIANELVVDLSASAPTVVRIELERTLILAPGSPAPEFGIDFGDDGTFELGELGATTVVLVATLDQQPIRTRLRSRLSQIGVGSIALDLAMRVLPQNSLFVSPVAIPCGWSNSTLVSPTFAGMGVECTPLLTTGASVIVLGLQLQPIALPPLSNGTQCQLIPSPDHLALLLPAQSLTVPIPAAARPVTLWIQGVDLTPNGLLSTDAWAVVAW